MKENNFQNSWKVAMEILKIYKRIVREKFVVRENSISHKKTFINKFLLSKETGERNFCNVTNLNHRKRETIPILRFLSHACITFPSFGLLQEESSLVKFDGQPLEDCAMQPGRNTRTVKQESSFAVIVSVCWTYFVFSFLLYLLYLNLF